MRFSNHKTADAAAPKKLTRIATAHESQLPMFQPSRRPATIVKRHHETAFGSITVSGKLGQGHRDLLDALLLHREKKHFKDGGRLSVLVDPYQIRKAISAGRTPLPYNYIHKLLEDMRQARVEMIWDDGKQHHRMTEGIIALFEEASSKPVTHGTCNFAHRDDDGGDSDRRAMLKVTFSKAMTYLLRDDQNIHYKLAPIVSLTHGLSQAIARYCLSHTSVHETFEGICARVGFDTGSKNPSAARKAKMELLIDAAALAALGVEVKENGSVHHTGSRGDRVTHIPGK
ncbi:hypothetical protein AB4090_12585 [Acidithiobacillus sp. IBUN Pt1247-S3]